MSDIVERLLSGTPGGDSTYPAIMTEAARIIEILRTELAKVNMENDRLTRTNRAKREHRDKLLQTTAKQADEIDRLRAALRVFACDCAVGERCSVPDNCRNFQARRELEQKP